MSRSTGKNLITFGAPGTGKSYSMSSLIMSIFTDNDLEISEDDVRTLPDTIAIRTTFHPDSDYSTFVGCYKPQDLDGKGIITYKFSPQAFITAYLKAWSTEAPFFLVIEEINRGNCAQIFGDIFQLLDRKPDGEHEYDITPDKDIEVYVKSWFKANPTNLDIPEVIKNGTKLYLPKNMTILATMNTSDQSLFPMDSAFKRRWEWRFQNIEAGGKERKIQVDDSTWYSWWSFLKAVNKCIYNVTKSEDKQLGYWFVKVDDSILEPIDTNLFISKVIFYLWSDVFKDYGNSNDSPFSVKHISPEEEEQETNETRKDHFTFQSFFGLNGLYNLKRFLDGLKISPNTMDAEDVMSEEERLKAQGKQLEYEIAKPISLKNKKQILTSSFIMDFKQHNPEFKLNRDGEDFTRKKAKITFINREIEPFVGNFTKALDFILETIGYESVRMFKEVNGGTGYAVVCKGSPEDLKSKLSYGNPSALGGELKGFSRITNKCGNDMVDIFYEMLNLVEKKEDLYTIEISK